MIVLLLEFVYIFCVYEKGNILSKLSEVRIKVNGTGEIKLFSDNFFRKYKNCEIYLNDTFFYKKNHNYFDSNYFQNISLNFIKIIWNDTIITTENMFEECNQIIEIDLSKFDSSKVSNTSKMFFNCKSLISLNLSNFETSLVKDVGYVFCNCRKLISLNISTFRTSEVNYMNFMFYYCKSLTVLDLQ